MVVDKSTSVVEPLWRWSNFLSKSLV